MVDLTTPTERNPALTSVDQDPLLDREPLPLHATYHPLGFCLDLSTNSELLLRSAEASWKHFSSRFSQPPIRLYLGVRGTDANPCPFPPVCRRQEHLLTTVADAHNFVSCDLRQGFAFGWVTEDLARNSAYLRYHFLESAALVMLSSLYLIPLHAACVSQEGNGILLCGDSGAGKSSLAFACVRAGWEFTSDDASYLIRHRADRSVIANPYQMRFRESAISLFPELSSEAITPRFSGKLSIEMPTSRVPGLVAKPECRVDHIVFLRRRADSEARLASLPKSAALAWVRKHALDAEYGPKSQAASYRELLKAGVYELQYSDLSQAVERLELLAQTGF